MSFRADDQRRYGQVPPVQYPVAGQRPERHAASRRLSFNTGDDGAYNGARAQDRPSVPGHGASPSATNEELFMASPTSPTARAPFGSVNSALSGYQHQIQDHTPRSPPGQSTYNPQSFAPSAAYRSPTSAVPHHAHHLSHSSSRYSATSGSAYGASPPGSYAPQAYNPAAYANASVPQRHATYSAYGQDQGYGASVGSGASTVYGQLPGTTYPPTLPQRPPSSGHPSAYDPSQFAGGPYGSRNSSFDAQGPTAYSPASQAPYPDSSHIPVGPNYDANDHHLSYTRPYRSESQPLPPSPSRLQQQSSVGLQRHPTNAPLPSRPLEEMDDDRVYWDSNGRPLGREPSTEEMTSESIMQEIEAGLGETGRWSGRRPSPVNGNRRAGSQSPLRGHAATTFLEEDDDEDPEGTAGLIAMRQAELDDQWFGGSTLRNNDLHPNPLPPPPQEQNLSSEAPLEGGLDGTFDLSMLSGGHAGNIAYGSDFGTTVNSSSLANDLARPLPSPAYYNSIKPSYDQVATYNNAEMDYGGTGGLQAPRAHRLSFDEGREERVSVHSHQSGADSPTRDDFHDQDLFYHPGLTHRPLPALPTGPGSDSSSMLSAQNSFRSQHQHHHSMSADAGYYQAGAPERYYQTGAQTLQPERSISLSSHSYTPQVQTPARSRTDATEDRKKTRQHMLSPSQGQLPESEVASGLGGGAFDGITLPSGRKKKFAPSKLTANDFANCQEPWALSNIEAWIRSMGDGEIDLKEKTIEEALINLFTHKIANLNVADAEVLSNHAIQLMLQSGTLIPDEEWVKFGEGHISGVLWQMTGAGCYAPKLHDAEIPGHCYSHHCMRTSKRLSLGSMLFASTEEIQWHLFHGLKVEDLATKPKKEVERQNILHEIVYTEYNYLQQLEIWRHLYRDDLRSRKPAVINPEKLDRFCAFAFGKTDALFNINKDHLLSPLKYRRNEQGPWIVGFSDIFREWVRKARSDYIEFSGIYPRAEYMIRREADKNILFKKFLDEKQKHELSGKQDWTHFLIQPVQRLTRYAFLLNSVYANTIEDSEEKANLQRAIEEIKNVTLECNAKVADTNKRVQMMELDRMLVLRPGFQSVLNLDHLGRVLIREGELQRMSSKGMRWVDTHALLFDHYLILAKVVAPKDAKGDKYDVSREPIPMPLLFLESINDEAVVKQKVIGAPLSRTAAVATAGAQNLKTGAGVEHTATGLSTNSLTSASSNEAEGKILYPFKLKHLGYEVYTLYAPTAHNRLDWCTSIIEAKTRHAKALFSQNAEPFRLRVLADASFHYDPGSTNSKVSGVPVKGTPLDRAIEQIESVLGSAQGIAPVCRAQVNCATGFSAFGKSVMAIGTDFGIYVTDPSEPRGWRRTVQTARVTQIAVLEEFSVCLVIADRSLVSYPLDVVAPCSDFAPPINDTPRRAPQRLAKDVTYFATSRMKDRMLVFYKRKDGLYTHFKVLEPILPKAAEKKSRLFGGRKAAAGSTDTFRDFDEFYLPTDCYSLSLFHTYIAVSTAKGVEMLTLDKKQPMSIPDLKSPTIANIAGRIREQRPLGMFRLNDNEFIVTYEDCAVYVDKHGDVSRTLIMEYTGKQKKAKGAAMYGQYLLLYNEDYVEVRNAENGRLRQIIAGRDVRIIDYGIRGPTGGNAAQSQLIFGQHGQLSTAGEVCKGSVKIAMCHPELPGKQIILEMLLNDGHAE
ncbi:hypothetical protein HIM_04693 [Hirsutella minnesotensis 3608]|uniref:Rho1 guanine nucleotide exchange factor 3 n=1 Tax=Hirsutella minnesotensis 3608 TaxID=1043627 RepID=A0A0F8A5T1_9HYPO|nr:hypothetical protein HIM_04693 [Hirsutella minnesotensis 3608]